MRRILALAFAGCLGAAPVRALELPHAADPVQYRVVQQDIAGVIAGIAAECGVRADVSAKIQGDVRGRLPDGSVHDTLDRLGALYGFDWYFDGQTLHASSWAESQSRVLPLGTVSGQTYLETLNAFGVADARWPVRLSADGDVAFVSGPPRMVTLAENVLSALAQRPQITATSVRVFRGGTAGS